MIRRLLPSGSESEWRDPSGTVRLAEIHVDTGWVGRRALDIETATGARVAFLTRLGEGLLPKPDTVIQEGDLVHVILLESDAKAVENQLGTKPEEQ
jgi:trk/ktr system potassium uptake protein